MIGLGDLGNIGEHISEEEGKPADKEDNQYDHLPFEHLYLLEGSKGRDYQGLCSIDIVPQGFIPARKEIV